MQITPAASSPSGSRKAFSAGGKAVGFPEAGNQ